MPNNMQPTIQFMLRPDIEWSRPFTNARLSDLAVYARDIGIHEISPCVELWYQNGRIVPTDLAEQYKTETAGMVRLVTTPYRPGAQYPQVANYATFYKFKPSEHAPWFVIGIAEYDLATLPPSVPEWDYLADESYITKASRALLQAFCRRWSLSRLNRAKSKEWLDRRVLIQEYFRSPNVVVGCFRDRRDNPVNAVVLQGKRHVFVLRQRGYGCHSFDDPEFKRELGFIAGNEPIYIAGSREWTGTYNSAAANVPEYGGLDHFILVHTRVCAILHEAKRRGFRLCVWDRGGLWRQWDILRLCDPNDRDMLELYNTAVTDTPGNFALPASTYFLRPREFRKPRCDRRKMRRDKVTGFIDRRDFFDAIIRMATSRIKAKRIPLPTPG